jgi:hypothetical protein
VKFKQLLANLVIAAGGALGVAGGANAAILCSDPGLNHMLMDTSIVSACLDSGEGNLTGNEDNDLFLTGVGGAYDLASKSDASNPYNIDYETDGDYFGRFSFDASIWDSYSNVAIGFKFGTGNRPDEWFVFSLNSLVSSGDWEFINVFDRGGGLSHVNLYGISGGTSVPEPPVVALLAFALVSLYFVRRRRKV